MGARRTNVLIPGVLPISSGWQIPGREAALRGPSKASRSPLWAVCLSLLTGLTRLSLAADPLISEFQAANRFTIKDEERSAEDWLEIYNPDPVAVDLGGWHLTDDRGRRDKWTFPPTVLAPGQTLLVFASGKDRSASGRPLHTNFHLDAAGEYLALVKSDGLTIAHEFAPAYPIQAVDVSYGAPAEEHEVQLISDRTPARLLVPTGGQLGAFWLQPAFVDLNWAPFTARVGFGSVLGPELAADPASPPAPNPPALPADCAQLMRGRNASVYLRVPFLVTNRADLVHLTFVIRYNDGFVAFLNGVELARRNAPTDSVEEPDLPSIPAWNAAALGAAASAESSTSLEIDASRFRDFLEQGTNVLAIHGLNVTADDPTFLLAPELTAVYRHLDYAHPTYLDRPTPGAVNSPGVGAVGPIISEVRHTPLLPRATDPLLVQAQVTPTLRPAAAVTLTYRVMFGLETTVPMYDDGRHGDGSAGDGRYGAEIPAGLALPGQMLRYFVVATDTERQATRSPAYTQPNRSPRYHGTVVEDLRLTNSRLPVLHWFIQNPTAADSDATARASLWFEGEFYDNIGMNLHGQSTRGFPKKSYDVRFDPGYAFAWSPDAPRVSDINLLTTWADKTHLRNVLAHETYRNAGAPGHFALAVRVQRNGAFFSVANLVENGDDRFLERLGLDPHGALYKMYNSAESTAGAEKKSRKEEGTADLLALIRGMSQANLAARQAFMFDHLDVPAMINHLTARVITADADCCHKNYYLYCDNDGTGQWQAMPWDVDLSFGRVWTCGSPCLAYFDEKIYTDQSIYLGLNNTVFAPLLNTSATRQMYLRRLRTLMDELQQPPGTAETNDQLRLRTLALRDRIAPDAALDLLKWGTWGRRETITQAVDRIWNEFLPGRRTRLFQTLSASGSREIPTSQPADALVRFDALEARPESGNPRQEWLSLTNANLFAVDLSGWRLEGAVRFTFAPGTVLPGRTALWVSPDLNAFRARTASPKGGERRLIVGPYAGELSARGDTLMLRDLAGREVSRKTYPGQPSPAQQWLRLTEIMYHPDRLASHAALDPEEFEFLVLRNTGSEVLDLSGVRLTAGVAFAFPSAAPVRLGPGGWVVLARNTNAFGLRYGRDVPVAGQFTGNLNNAGERLRLEDTWGEPILDFSYDPRWQPTTDGQGGTLAFEDDTAPWSRWGERSQWLATRSIPGVWSDRPPANRLDLAVSAAGVRVRYAGQPGAYVELKRSTNLVSWETVLGAAVPASRVLEWREQPRSAGPVFYRVSPR